MSPQVHTSLLLLTISQSTLFIANEDLYRLALSSIYLTITQVSPREHTLNHLLLNCTFNPFLDFIVQFFNAITLIFFNILSCLILNEVNFLALFIKLAFIKTHQQGIVLSICYIVFTLDQLIVSYQKKIIVLVIFYHSIVIE